MYSSGSGDPLWGLILTVGMVGIMIALTFVHRRRARRRRFRVPRGAAIDEPIPIETLRRDPAKWKQQLAGKVGCVGIATLMPDGTTDPGTHHSFIVDIRGAVHDVEYGRDPDAVAANARWLADLLGVPLQNESEGWAGTASDAPS